MQTTFRGVIDGRKGQIIINYKVEPNGFIDITSAFLNYVSKIGRKGLSSAGQIEFITEHKD